MTEPHPEKPDHQVHKIKLKTPLPPELADIAGDILHNLRSALDVAAYTVAVGSGCKDQSPVRSPSLGALRKWPTRSEGPRIFLSQ